MTSSNLVGVSTGSSLGRAPGEILSVRNRGRTMKQAALRPESYTKKVALVLQGGGALGSYQAGVYEALASSDYKPDWVAGISIGAINAALIAGNSPEMRVEKLREFWRTITTSVNGAGLPLDLGKQISAMRALMFGQSNFFAPRKPTDWWFGHTPTSYYDTSSLKSTLERLVDFDRINSREIRFSVGAVNVRTGNFAYVDNAEIEIRPRERRSAARVSLRGNRRRALLGRRPGIQYAAAIRDRVLPAP